MTFARTSLGLPISRHFQGVVHLQRRLIAVACADWFGGVLRLRCYALGHRLALRCRRQFLRLRRCARCRGFLRRRRLALRIPLSDVGRRCLCRFRPA